MLDYQRIIDNVRNSLYANGSEAQDAVRSAAAAYSLACQEVNERLRKCGELLKAGLRSEALQQAEMEPNLLDVVATLDFPEREVWTQYAAQFDVVAPPPLPLDISADLNEAYALEQPMVAILAKHRLLALARSPLRQRIKTLREIAATDSNNLIWLEDLQLYEQERFKQIQREAGDVLAADDLDTARALADELNDTSWSESPPDALFDRVSNSLQKLITSHARRELEQIDVDMNDAFSAFEIDTMRDLRDRWFALLPQSGFDGQSPICQRIAPALEWLVQHESKQTNERKHAAAIAALEEALEDEATTEPRLERLYRAATKHGEEIPAALDLRCKARVEALRLGARRKFRLKMFIAAAATLAIAVTISVVMIRNMWAANIHTHAAALAKLIEGSKLQEARKYAEQLTSRSPRVAMRPEVQSLIARADSLLKDDDDRRNRLALLMGDARKTVTEISDWPSQKHATNLLSEAEWWARSDSEKADVKRLQLSVADATRKLQKQEDDKFGPPLAKLSEQVRLLDGQKSDPASRQTEINRLRSEILALESRGENVTAALRDQIKPLFARLRAFEDELGKRQQQQAATAPITSAVGNGAEFLSTLAEYRKLYPDTVRSADFERVSEEAPLWKGMTRYTLLAENWAKHDHTAISPRTAKQLMDEAAGVLKEYEDYPDASLFQDRLPYLEAINRRGDNADQSLAEKLRTNYGKPWVADLSVVTLTNNDRYYMRVKPDISIENWANRAKYVVDFDLTERGFPLHKHKDVVSAENSAQAIWSADARKQLVNLADDQWEATMFRLLQAIYSNVEIDAVLRLTLFRQTLEVASQGSLPLERAFKAQVTAVNDPAIDPFANWLDPNDEKAKLARAKAEEILKNLPDLNTAAKQAAQDRQSLRNPVGNRYPWVGWLSRDENGNWQCICPKAVTTDGDLVVVFKSAQDDKPRIGRIGQVLNGAIRVAPSASDTFLEGRPVFVAVPLAGTKQGK